MSGEKRKVEHISSEENDIPTKMDTGDSLDEDDQHDMMKIINTIASGATKSGNMNHMGYRVHLQTFMATSASASKLESGRKKRKTKSECFVAATAGGAHEESKFVMKTLLGDGAQGRVYSCADTTTGKARVAVKVCAILRSDSERDKKMKELRNEIEINKKLSELKDPSFTTFFRTVEIVSEGEVVSGRSVDDVEYEEKEKRPPPGPYHALFLCFMPRYDSDLRKFLNHCYTKHYHEGTSWDNEIKVLFRDICEAMAKMHKHGIVNRDLKIDNIGLVLLRDKVMTLIADHGHGSGEVAGEGLTARKSGKTKEDRGTFGFKAPECGLDAGDKRDLIRIDVYALGMTLYTLLTISYAIGDDKQDNYNWKNYASERFEVASDVIEQIHNRTGASLMPKAAKLLKKMLAVNPKDRYASFDEVLKDDWFKMTDDDRKKANQSLVDKFRKFCKDARDRVDKFNEARAEDATASKCDTGGAMDSSKDNSTEGASKTTDESSASTTRSLRSSGSSRGLTPSVSNTRSLRPSGTRGLTPSGSTTRSLKSPAVELISEHYVILPASRPFAWNEALDAVSAAVDMELIEEVVSVTADRKAVKMITLTFRSEKETIMVNVKLATAPSKDDAGGHRGALLFELEWGRRETFLSFLAKARESMA